MSRKIVSTLILLVIISLSNISFAQEKTKYDDLFAMSLEEIMNAVVDIGTLTGIELSKLPLSLTTITAEDIKHTPAGISWI